MAIPTFLVVVGVAIPTAAGISAGGACTTSTLKQYMQYKQYKHVESIHAIW